MSRSHGVGVRPRHSRKCTSHAAGACTCDPSWEAHVYDKYEERKVRRTFATRDEAIAWRGQMLADSGPASTPARRSLAYLMSAAAEINGAITLRIEADKDAADLMAALRAAYAAIDVVSVVAHGELVA